MGKSVKSRHYQKIIQKGSWMERLPKATYLQKWYRWKGFQGQHFYRNGTDGRASKGNIFTEKLWMERLPRATYLQKGAKVGLGVS